MKRHIAKIRNTDQRCVVAYMQIPGTTRTAMVIPTDTLPPRFQQWVIDIVDSPEGQQAENLADVLFRRQMPDASKTVMQALHDAKYLVSAPVENVLMMPRPNMPFSLLDILRGMGRLDDSKEPSAHEALPLNIERNPLAVNAQALNAEERTARARTLLIDADFLQSDVDRKREAAYIMCPELRPDAGEPESGGQTGDGEPAQDDTPDSSGEPTDDAPTDAPTEDGVKLEEGEKAEDAEKADDDKPHDDKKPDRRKAADRKKPDAS